MLHAEDWIGIGQLAALRAAPGSREARLATSERYRGESGPMRLVLVILVLATLPAAASPPAMQVDGAPFFPLGWYTSNPCSTVEAARSHMAPMQAQGMNSALICYGVEDSDAAMTSYLEAGGQVGMKIMVEVQRYAVQGLEGYPPSLIDHEVDLCKDYPAFLGWYLMDEPEYWGVTPAMLQARYAQIKGRDPLHDILVCHGTYPTNNPGDQLTSTPSRRPTRMT